MAGRPVRHPMGVALAGLLVLAGALLGTGPAVAAPRSEADARTSAVQAMLDRVLGPGASVVQVAEDVQAASGVRTRVSYGAALPASSSITAVAGAGASVVSQAQQNLVGSTATTTVQPAGAVLRETVTVVVDRSRTAGLTRAALRRLVAAAAGVVPKRGDRVLVVLTHLPVASAARPAAPRTDLLAQAVPLVWGAGGVAALGVLLVMLRRRPAR